MKNTYLLQAAHAAPSADNSQPWHFFEAGNTLSITYDSARVHGLTFPAWEPATLLSMGGVIENIHRAARDSGTPINLELLPKDCPHEDCYARIELPSDGSLPAEQSDHPIFHRHTNRFRYAKKPIPSQVLDNLASSSEGSAHVLGFYSSEETKVLAELAQTASEVRFQTQEIHEWLGQSLRFDPAEVKKADGLDVNTFDLPPGGRQLLKFISEWPRIRVLNKFGMYKLLAAIDSAPLKKAAGILAITGAPDHRGGLDAGRVLTRVWTYLNSEGIAVHPYYVVPDQIFRLDSGGVPEHLTHQIEKVSHEAKQIFRLDNDRVIYMMLRIGYPTRNAPRSLRIPLNKVFTNLS